MNNSASEKVTFVYVHGIVTRDPSDFEEKAKVLHKYFKGQNFGKYIISDNYEIINWRDLLLADVPMELFKDGLVRINSDHNELKVKKTSKPNILVATRPIYKILQFFEGGATTGAVFLRNLFHNYVFNLFWFAGNRIDKVFDVLQEKINNTDGKFVILAHSLGTPLAVRFIWDRIILGTDRSENQSNKENFVGLITTGDVNNTVLASKWSDQVVTADFDPNKPDFVRFLIDNNKFWIVCNHRNDIIATGLANKITSFNDKGPGFISYNTSKTTLIGNIISLLRFWDRSNGLIQSHRWLFNNPKEFSKCVLDAYSRMSSK